MAFEGDLLPDGHHREDTRSFGATVSSEVIEQFKETIRGEYGKSKGVTGVVLESLMLDYIERHDDGTPESVSNRELLREIESLRDELEDAPPLDRSKQNKRDEVVYSPDTFSGTLTAEQMREIVNRDDPEFNSDHLPDSLSAWPQSVGVKMEIMAGMVRYETDLSRVEQETVTAIIDAHYGEMASQTYQQYVSGVPEQFISDPHDDAYWVTPEAFESEYQTEIDILRACRDVNEAANVRDVDAAMEHIYDDAVTPDQRMDALQSVLDAIESADEDVLRAFAVGEWNDEDIRKNRRDPAEAIRKWFESRHLRISEVGEQYQDVVVDASIPISVDLPV